MYCLAFGGWPLGTLSNELHRNFSATTFKSQGGRQQLSRMHMSCLADTDMVRLQRAISSVSLLTRKNRICGSILLACRLFERRCQRMC